MIKKEYLLNLKSKYEKINEKVKASDVNKIPGSLLILYSDSKIKYYHSQYINKEPTRSYIPRDNINLAKQLAQKKYHKKLKPIVNTNLKIINYILDNYTEETPQDAYYCLSNEEQKLIETVEPTWEELVEKFYKSENKMMNYEIPNPVYTKKNEPVRSKSERLIADILYEKNIPYIYENTIKLANGKLLCPDFTILTRKGRIIYLEHIGMLDNPKYENGAYEKFFNYQDNRCLLGINILYTFETSTRPLNQDVIYHLVDKYLL